jgi:hypothetical protein
MVQIRGDGRHAHVFLHLDTINIWGKSPSAVRSLSCATIQALPIWSSHLMQHLRRMAAEGYR